MRLGIAISTYVNKSGEQEDRLLHMLDSLLTSKFKGPIFVVDDGSTARDWSRFYKQIPAKVLTIRKTRNTGISATKNTCLRLLSEAKVDIGFLADDDIEFREKWWQSYVEAHVCTNLDHFSFAFKKLREEVVEINDYCVMRCSGVCGCLLSFTPAVLRVVGGFPVSPVKWGHDHVNWTNRIVKAGMIPFYVDAVNSIDFIQSNPYSTYSPVSISQRQENRQYHFELGPINQPLIG